MAENIPGASIVGIPVPLRDPKEDLGQEGNEPADKHHAVAADKTGSPPSRLSLRISANWWRSMEYIGMSMHFMAPPRPPNPAFTRTIPSTLSDKKGRFKLLFYTPDSYKSGTDPNVIFPAVVNFHGGGFTIGSPTDDARFARFVLETCNAVFISVDYRLAPEHPFPTAVDDGADALLYVLRHAAELRIDPNKLATSGFSAGGNLALTAPLRLRSYLKSTPAGSEPAPVPPGRLVAAVAWYPSTDYTRSRAVRRATAIHPEHALPSMFTDLFDAAYLYPPDLDLADPLLSPSQATDGVLADGIPPNVLFYTCEWDMLLREGEDLAKRLAAPPLDKKVAYRMIPGVPHGWDKSPNPLKPPEKSEELYRDCCRKLRDIFQA